MSRHSRDIARTWFTRDQGIVKGPFPSGTIRRLVVLGRLSERSEVSPDGYNWQPLGSITRLLPDATASEFGQQSAELARRREDERRGERRRDSAGTTNERRRSDRRRPEPAKVLQWRLRRRRNLARVERRASRQAAALWLTGLLAPLLAGGIYLAASRPVGGPTPHDCRAPPAPGVDWTHCGLAEARLDDADLSRARIDDADLADASLRQARLRGADLSYSNLQRTNLAGADLTQTRLVGADLRSADLTGVHLGRSDLSFADLRGALVDGADLDGARLGEALWVDGRTCAGGSVGACR